MKSEAVKPVRKVRIHVGNTLSHIFLICVSLIVLFPFLWMLDTALKPNAQVFQFPPSLLPSTFQWSNFLQIWTYLPFGNIILNSVLVAGLGTILTLITSSLAAYAFARLNFFGRDNMFLIYLGTLSEWSYMMAASTISVLPGILLVILLQRYLVEGISLSGLGGR